jgi:hypothetical protein
MTGRLILSSFPGLMACGGPTQWIALHTLITHNYQYLIVDSGVWALLLLMPLQPIGQMRLTGGSLLCIWLVHLVSRVLRHAEECKTMGTLVVPAWKSASYWLLLCPDGSHLAPFVHVHFLFRNSLPAWEEWE